MHSFEPEAGSFYEQEVVRLNKIKDRLLEAINTIKEKPVVGVDISFPIYDVEDAEKIAKELDIILLEIGTCDVRYQEEKLFLWWLRKLLGMEYKRELFLRGIYSSVTEEEFHEYTKRYNTNYLPETTFAVYLSERDVRIREAGR